METGSLLRRRTFLEAAPRVVYNQGRFQRLGSKERIFIMRRFFPALAVLTAAFAVSCGSPGDETASRKTGEEHGMATAAPTETTRQNVPPIDQIHATKIETATFATG